MQAPKEQPAWEREARAHTEPVDRKAVAGRSRWDGEFVYALVEKK